MTIALFHGRGLIPSLIRWQTRGRYSHAAVVVKTEPLTIIEAWSSGVREKTLTDLRRIDLFQVIPTVDEGAALTFAREQIGFKYDFRSVFRFVTKIPAATNNRWFCSELVAATLEAGGVRLLNMDSAEVAPTHLSWSPLLRRLGEPLPFVGWPGTTLV